MAYTVALMGNPNVGKSVVFNNLVPGARQHVGNWPGKTVEKKEGRCVHKGTELLIVDLPGTYSLTARAVDELIARNYIVEEKPDIVVDIVDASNIERNLYLTLLLLELEANVVVALNMFDIARDKGYKINFERLAENLGVPIVPTVATTGEGMEALKDTIVKAAENRRGGRAKMTYGEDVEELIDSMARVIRIDEDLAGKYPVRWLAIKLLERDEDVMEKVRSSRVWREIWEVIA